MTVPASITESGRRPWVQRARELRRNGTIGTDVGVSALSDTDDCRSSSHGSVPRSCSPCWWRGHGDELDALPPGSPGARFVGHNRTPQREWETISEVIADVPGKHFAWSVGPGRAVWGYRMRSVDEGGTELTEYTRTTPSFEEVFAERYGDRAEEEIAVRFEAAREGIPATLTAIAATF